MLQLLLLLLLVMLLLPLLLMLLCFAMASERFEYLAHQFAMTLHMLAPSGSAEILQDLPHGAPHMPGRHRHGQ